MNLSRTSGLTTTRFTPGLQKISAQVSSASALSTLAKLILGALVIALFLVPPLPWNIRIPLYLIMLVWTILRPRTALYLMTIAVPWGSLDFLDVSGLRLNSADILVGMLALAWLMSWALPASMRG